MLIERHSVQKNRRLKLLKKMSYCLSANARFLPLKVLNFKMVQLTSEQKIFVVTIYN